MAWRGRRIFGTVVNGEVRLNAWGRIAIACWEALPAHFPRVRLDAVVVMPNHVHGIIWITRVPFRHRRASDRGPSHGPRVEPGSLGAVVRSYKSAVTRAIHAIPGAFGGAVWKRNYYERIIWDDTVLFRVRRYIEQNPAHWSHRSK